MDKELRSDEEFWRGGLPSGQRDLITAVQQLMNDYQLVAQFDMYPYHRPVYVFVRPTTEYRPEANGAAR
jgi:hypothetical protein